MFATKPSCRGPSRYVSFCTSSEDINQASTHKKLHCLLTLIDSFMGWMETSPISKETADVMAQVLLEHIIPRFGIPSLQAPGTSMLVLSRLRRASIQQLGPGFPRCPDEGCICFPVSLIHPCVLYNQCTSRSILSGCLPFYCGELCSWGQ